MSNRRRGVKFFFLFLLIAFLVVLFVVIVGGFIYISSLPSLEELTPSPIAQTSKVYSIDGKLITEFHAEENREIINFDQMSPYIKDAIIAVEDKRYYEHQGVDYVRILGALIADLKAGELAQGGSTITQQYVKNVYFSPEKTWSRKIKEAAIAIQLERHYTKDKVLEMYLNTILFGAGTYGIEKASQLYFGVHASELTVDQAALLAGLARSPENYSPFNNMERAEKRRNLVLSLMYEQEMIDKDQYFEALTAPIELNETNPYETGDPSPGIAPYFIDYIKQQLYDQKFTDYDVFKGGLRIYTTLDLELQQKAEQAVKQVFPEDIGPSYSLICTNPSNGYIHALIGGKDYQKNKFNIATQGKRQPGSVFKVMVLAEALRQHIPMQTTYNPNGPITIELPQSPSWQVDNYGGQKFDRELNIEEATIHSVNVIYAQLMMEVGAENVEALCQEMDIQDIGSNPAIALGGLEVGVTPLDISKAFSTFAAGGIYHPPVSILKITDAQGNALYDYQEQAEQPEKQIMEPAYAYKLTQILSKVIKEGTGTGANIGRPAAGKTGTTSDHRDAWFAGYTPDLVTVVWMGHPESSQSMEPINGRTVVGGSFPADIWNKFMSAALEGLPVRDFAVPGEEIIDIEVCSESGLLPAPWCPEELLEYQSFAQGQQPQEYCQIHNKVKVPSLIGVDIEQARQILEELHFSVEEITEHNDTYASNIVFAQEPAPETVLESTDGQLPNITVKISKGRETVAMPSLLGLEQDEAQEILAGFGLSITNIINEFNQQYQPPKIYDQEPKPGTEIAIDTPVTIYVSKGVNPEANVPDVITLTRAEALAKLQESGFSNITVLEEEGTAAIGIVFNQVPLPQTLYNKGAEVIIRVSLGVLVPEVVGLDRDQAVQMLEAKGLVAEISGKDIKGGIVANQTPVGGSYINYGSTVKIKLEEPLLEPEEETDSS
ncbi:MAG: PBP1A family penicillin-binding protein [Actinomycetota bacterium]|nr:PBP1A family penicillin-binding protein [Actinomycetota bacterium]